MKCPRCGDKMRVTNTWNPDDLRERRQVCPRCNIVCRTVERVVETKISENSENFAICSKEEKK